MKEIYQASFRLHVKAAVEKAVAIGAGATWSTEKHLAALADAIEANPTALRDVLQDCYNISGYQQTLESKFKGTVHFQRAKKKPIAEAADDWMAALAKDSAGTKQG